MFYLKTSFKRVSCTCLETWRLEIWGWSFHPTKSLTKWSCRSIEMGVSAYTMDAMATVRGVPDWIWLSGRQGWARQPRTWRPECVWVCVCPCVCVWPQISSASYVVIVNVENWRLCVQSSFFLFCFFFSVCVWVDRVYFESMRIWLSIWSHVRGGTQAPKPFTENTLLSCISRTRELFGFAWPE